MSSVIGGGRTHLLQRIIKNTKGINMDTKGTNLDTRGATSVVTHLLQGITVVWLHLHHTLKVAQRTVREEARVKESSSVIRRYLQYHTERTLTGCSIEF